MYDLLPFPQITATDPREQVKQVTEYLMRFKEELEFILTSSSVENLSPELIERLNGLGADIETSNVEREEQLTQMNARSLTVSDVINSSAFETALKNNTPTFSINFETGNLEYE